MTFLDDLTGCLRQALGGHSSDHALINLRDSEDDGGAADLETRLAVIGQVQTAGYKVRFWGRVQLKIYADRAEDAAHVLAAVERLWPVFRPPGLLRLVWDPWEIPVEPLTLRNGITRHTRTRSFTAWLTT